MSLFTDKDYVHIGFTGTQKGMTDAQKTSVHDATHSFRRKGHLIIGHHGDCVGADAEFHEYLDGRSWCCAIVIHPPLNESKRAWCVSKKAAVREPLPYLDRNKEIVTASQYMLATPAEFEEQQRSGTWSTIRYAHNMQMAGLIIFPDGQVKDIRFWK